MNWLLGIFILLALFSSKIGRIGATPASHLPELPGWVAYPLGLFLQLFLFFPLIPAFQWGESLVSLPGRGSGGIKAILLIVCWAIVVGQYIYHLGLRDGQRRNAHRDVAA
jgi:hypothetical protein